MVALCFFSTADRAVSALQLQAFFLVADDIMDNSITRRGQPCWYRVPEVATLLFKRLPVHDAEAHQARLTPPGPSGTVQDASQDAAMRCRRHRWLCCADRAHVQLQVGLVACNDYIILESCIYRVLKKHFAGKSYYPLLLDFFHEVRPLMHLIDPCMRAAKVPVPIMDAYAQEGLHMMQQLRT